MPLAAAAAVATKRKLSQGRVVVAKQPGARAAQGGVKRARTQQQDQAPPPEEPVQDGAAEAELELKRLRDELQRMKNELNEWALWERRQREVSMLERDRTSQVFARELRRLEREGAA